MLKNVHVVTHALIPWSIDLKDGRTYYFQRWQVYGTFCIPATNEYIQWTGDDGEDYWIRVYEEDWFEATSDANSVETQPLLFNLWGAWMRALVTN